MIPWGVRPFFQVELNNYKRINSVYFNMFCHVLTFQKRYSVRDHTRLFYSNY